MKVSAVENNHELVARVVLPFLQKGDVAGMPSYDDMGTNFEVIRPHLKAPTTKGSKVEVAVGLSADANMKAFGLIVYVKNLTSKTLVLNAESKAGGDVLTCFDTNGREQKSYPMGEPETPKEEWISDGAKVAILAGKSRKVSAAVLTDPSKYSRCVFSNFPESGDTMEVALNVVN